MFFALQNKVRVIFGLAAQAGPIRTLHRRSIQVVKYVENQKVDEYKTVTPPYAAALNFVASDLPDHRGIELVQCHTS